MIKNSYAPMSDLKITKLQKTTIWWNDVLIPILDTPKIFVTLTYKRFSTHTLMNGGNLNACHLAQLGRIIRWVIIGRLYERKLYKSFKIYTIIQAKVELPHLKIYTNMQLSDYWKYFGSSWYTCKTLPYQIHLTFLISMHPWGFTWFLTILKINAHLLPPNLIHPAIICFIYRDNPRIL